ncbi:MAG: dihydrofolate reductase [Balneolaceae bacterium]
MTLALIAAHDPNLLIGAQGGLPWHFKEDLRFFRKTTMGCPVIMGRGVFEELGEKPLPGRTNLVLSKTRDYPETGVDVFRSLKAALDSVKDRETVFVIGGGQVYRETIRQADELYITEIHAEYEGDTYFPEYRNDISSRWKETWREDHPQFSFIHYRENQQSLPLI